MVDAVLARVDRTRKTVTIATAASNLDTPGWHGVPEWCGRFQVDWVPSKLHKGVARSIRIGACDVWRPVPYRTGTGSPDASLVGGDSWRVYVEAGRGLADCE